MTTTEDEMELYFTIDVLRDKLLNVVKPIPSEMDISKKLRKLSVYFSESSCSKNRDPDYIADPKRVKRTISYCDYLVNIIYSLSLVESDKGELLKCGIKLVDLVSIVYDEGADPGFFSSFILPGLTEMEDVETGRDLVRGADIAVCLRGDLSGNEFFPVLYRDLASGRVSTLEELSNY